MAPASSHPTERDPLLPLDTLNSPKSQAPTKVKKPWYRPRPLWLLPFVITVATCRGMSIAPRIEVFTQLACEDLRNRHHSAHRDTDYPVSSSIFPFNDTETHFQPHINTDAHLRSQAPVLLEPVLSLPTTHVLDHEGDGVEDPDPIHDNPIDCTNDPQVQAGAAKMQTVMTTTMGILTVITTGWWGQFGDRHGRNKVLGAAVTGLLFTDIMFMIASNPPDILKGRAYYLLIVAPIVEGSLGGWATVHGGMHAYLSDCTTQGSRAHIFSLFAGMIYVGLAIGPEIAALVLRFTHVTTFVFCTSAILATINLFLVLFVFPESLSVEARTRNIEAAKEARMKASQDGSGKMGVWRSTRYAVKSFIEPLAVFGPVQRAHGRGRDWSLTLVGVSTLCLHLSVGVFQFRYMYAKYAFSWNPEALSYYVTAAGAVRGLWLLLILPSLLALVKPIFKPHLIREDSTSPIVLDSEASDTISPTVVSSGASETASPTVVADEDVAHQAAAPVVPDHDTPSSKKPLPSPSMLLREIRFDILVAKSCALLDLSSHTLVTLATFSSAPLFVVFSLIAAAGAGTLPAMHSVAMCTLNLREALQGGKGAKESGKLFGALAVLQAGGGSILGPMLFGMTYSLTVAVFPKAIFVVAASLLLVSISMMMMIRPPKVDVPIEIRVERQVSIQIERTHLRGRPTGRKTISVP